jgi:hypothetical protein
MFPDESTAMPAATSVLLPLIVVVNTITPEGFNLVTKISSDGIYAPEPGITRPPVT